MFYDKKSSKPRLPFFFPCPIFRPLPCGKSTSKQPRINPGVICRNCSCVFLHNKAAFHEIEMVFWGFIPSFRTGSFFQRTGFWFRVRCAARWSKGTIGMIQNVVNIWEFCHWIDETVMPQDRFCCLVVIKPFPQIPFPCKHH